MGTQPYKRGEQGLQVTQVCVTRWPRRSRCCPLPAVWLRASHLTFPSLLVHLQCGHSDGLTLRVVVRFRVKELAQCLAHGKCLIMSGKKISPSKGYCEDPIIVPCTKQVLHICRWPFFPLYSSATLCFLQPLLYGKKESGDADESKTCWNPRERECI